MKRLSLILAGAALLLAAAHAGADLCTKCNGQSHANLLGLAYAHGHAH